MVSAFVLHREVHQNVKISQRLYWIFFYYFLYFGLVEDSMGEVFSCSDNTISESLRRAVWAMSIL